MKGREFKDVMYDGLSKLLKALANPYRLEIIEMLSQGEKSVEGIVQTTNLSFANEFLPLYQHIIKYAVREIAELERILNRQREDNKSTNAVRLDELETMLANK